MKTVHPRWILLLIFLLFGVPVVVATLMHTSWWQYRPTGMTNRGILVQPPLPLEFTGIRFGTPQQVVEAPSGQWVILYPLTAPCAGACLNDIENLRQIHRATGRRQQQLAIVLLVPPDSDDQTAALLEVYSAFRPGMDEGGQIAGTLQRIASVRADGALLPRQAFLVDPSGNIMMRYTADFDPTDLSKDLKRLLKLSEQDG